MGSPDGESKAVWISVATGVHASQPGTRGERSASAAFGEVAARGSPAIQVRFFRFGGTIQSSPVQRQETQIVQSELTLDDSLP